MTVGTTQNGSGEAAISEASVITEDTNANQGGNEDFNNNISTYKELRGRKVMKKFKK